MKKLLTVLSLTAIIATSAIVANASSVAYGNVGVCNVSGQINVSGSSAQATTQSILGVKYMSAKLFINGTQVDYKAVSESGNYKPCGVQTVWKALKYGDTISGIHYVDARKAGTAGTYWFGYTDR